MRRICSSLALEAAYNLAARLAGGAADCERERYGSAWDWCRPGMVEAVSLAAPAYSRAHAQVLRVAMAEGTSARAFPGSVRSPAGGARVPVEVYRCARPRLQAAAHDQWPFSMRNINNSAGTGTLGALVRRNNNPGRYFALSAGHVIAGHPGAVFGDSVLVNLSHKRLPGKLYEWRPSIGSPVTDTDIDAGLAELSSEDARDLAAALGAELPTGAIGAIETGMPVTIRTKQSGRTIDANIVGIRSGWIDVDTTSTTRDYYFHDGVTYNSTTAAPESGDSGAAVWNSLEELIGLHFAGRLNGATDSNGVFCPIDRVLKAFGISVVTRQSAQAVFNLPALVSAAEPVAQAGEAAPADVPAAPVVAANPPNAAATPTNEEAILARTLWGEARGEGEEGMRAVAAVVLNRVRKKTYWGKTIVEVCRKPYQFSCWNTNDPNLPRLLNVGTEDTLFRAALGVADEAARGNLVDPTGGATHYFANWLVPIPAWAVGKTPSATIGRHVFFTSIA